MIKKVVFLGVLLLVGFLVFLKVRSSQVKSSEEVISVESLPQRSFQAPKEVPIIQAPEIPQSMPLKEKVKGNP